MDDGNNLKITREEISQSLGTGDWAVRYPPILSVEQAAELLQVPRGTVYQWHSQRRLRRCAQRIGKYLRFYRDRLILLAMNEGI